MGLLYLYIVYHNATFLENMNVSIVDLAFNDIDTGVLFEEYFGKRLELKCLQ
jgi:hypothetical protein